MREKRCKACGERFTPSRPLQAVCSPRCAIAWVSKEEQKKRKKWIRDQKQAFLDSDIKTWKARAKKACHKYIRERDKDAGCISCGKPLAGCKFDAGHYMPSGNNSAIRYDETNIHGQCVRCNMYKSGNQTQYRKRLVRRIGLERVEWLETQKQVKTWTIEDLRGVEAHYKAKIKELVEKPPTPDRITPSI